MPSPNSRAIVFSRRNAFRLYTRQVHGGCNSYRQNLPQLLGEEPGMDGRLATLPGLLNQPGETETKGNSRSSPRRWLRSPLDASNRLPSRGQEKSKISPQVKWVDGCAAPPDRGSPAAVASSGGAPPSGGRRKTLSTDSALARYTSHFPSGEPIPRLDLASLVMLDPCRSERMSCDSHPLCESNRRWRTLQTE